MGQRQKLHKQLELALGSKRVYYQPPPSVKLEYPCIIYSKTDRELLRADDSVYKSFDRYQVVVLYTDPDLEATDHVLSLPWATYNRHYAVNNVYHDVLYVYSD